MITKGMRVKTKVSELAYDDKTVIPKGSIGLVSNDHCLTTIGPKQFFHTVDFIINGITYRAAYHNEEISISKRG